MPRDVMSFFLWPHYNHVLKIPEAFQTSQSMSQHDLADPYKTWRWSLERDSRQPLPRDGRGWPTLDDLGIPVHFIIAYRLHKYMYL